MLDHHQYDKTYHTKGGFNNRQDVWPYCLGFSYAGDKTFHFFTTLEKKAKFE